MRYSSSRYQEADIDDLLVIHEVLPRIRHHATGGIITHPGEVSDRIRERLRVAIPLTDIHEMMRGKEFRPTKNTNPYESGIIILPEGIDLLIGRINTHILQTWEEAKECRS